MSEISGVKVIDTDAIHDNVSDEINQITDKASPVGADVLIIEDSAASWAKKKVSITNLPGGADPDAIHDNVADEIHQITSKATPVGADEFLIEDSEATWNKKRLAMSAISITESQISDLDHDDVDALHDNVAQEIQPITAKAAPVGADVVVIEDSAASWAKKSVTLTNLWGQAGHLSNIVEDTTPQLGGDLDLNSKGITEEFTAAVALSPGDLCYMNASGEMDLADADAEATCGTLLAIALDTIGASSTGTFLLFGKYTTSGLTAGDLYFVSLTAGDWTNTRPSGSADIVRIIGTALSTTVLYFRPDSTYIKIA